MVPYLPQRYYSLTEYQFGEEQSDAILRTAAYHRRDYSLSVIWFSPREHADIHSSIATPFPSNPTGGIGSLNRLPLELLHNVLLQLDIQSLFTFRQTSLASRQAVDSLHEYQVAVSHGLNLLCALLRSRLAIGVSTLDVYNALCTKACDLCAEFGGFLSLLTWKRCCFQCLQEAPELQVQSLASARKQLYLTKVDISHLTSFRTFPGIYSIAELERRQRIRVVSTYQAIKVSRLKPLQQRTAVSERDWLFNFMGTVALPYYDKVTGKLEHGVSCAGCQLAIEKDIIGAGGEKWAYDARDKVYSNGGFLQHFKWCEQAQGLWKSSGEGTRQPTELPEMARRRGFNMRE